MDSWVFSLNHWMISFRHLWWVPVWRVSISGPPSAPEVRVSSSYLDEAKAPCPMFYGAGPFHTTCLPWKSMSKSPLWAGTVWRSNLQHRVINNNNKPLPCATRAYSRLPGQETMVRVIRPLSSFSKRTRAVWVIPHVLFPFTSSRMSPHLEEESEIAD